MKKITRSTSALNAATERLAHKMLNFLIKIHMAVSFPPCGWRHLVRKSIREHVHVRLEWFCFPTGIQHNGHAIRIIFRQKFHCYIIFILGEFCAQVSGIDNVHKEVESHQSFWHSVSFWEWLLTNSTRLPPQTTVWETLIKIFLSVRIFIDHQKRSIEVFSNF